VPRHLYEFYFEHVLPLVGRVVSKHMTAYRYLPDSVRQFPQDRVLVELLKRVGFSGVRQQRLTSGVASLYWGRLLPESGSNADSPLHGSTVEGPS
jgi:demethylmenaquinone methyltransferase/2-methoxy-6-polyprenyl-1,4-benzoquinol methylase